MRSWIFFVFFVVLISCSSPKAIFHIAHDTLTAPTTIQCIHDVIHADKYEWNFGDGATSTDINPTHMYLQSGRYDVTLKVHKGSRTGQKTSELIIAPPTDCLVYMQTTVGNLLIKLYDQTPLHRDNFLKLCQSGYYNGLLFHRVIKGFMVQGGDPNSKNAVSGQKLGGGSPEYTIPSELVDTLVHTKGALAAARMNDDMNPTKSSNGSQFYLVQGRKISEDQLHRFELEKGISYSDYAKNKYYTIGGYPALDKNYTVFGTVLDGLDVIDKIAESNTDGADRPIEDIKILQITIIR